MQQRLAGSYWRWNGFRAPTRLQDLQVAGFDCRALLQKDEVNYVGQVKSPACRIIASIFQRPSGSPDCGVALSASSATIAAWGVRISRGRAKGRGVAEVRPLPAAISAKRSAAALMR